MKHIRNILLLITIIFAFVMQAEVYQNLLGITDERENKAQER